MVPRLLVFSECYKIQDSFESMQNFHSPQVAKISYNGIIDIYLDTVSHINVHTYSNFHGNVADEASHLL